MSLTRIVSWSILLRLPEVKKEENMKLSLRTGLSVIFILSLVLGPFNPVRASDGAGIEVMEVAAFAYGCIPYTGPYDEIPQIIAQVMPAMQQQGIMPMGPMIGIYYNNPQYTAPEGLEWEIGFPISAVATPREPLTKKIWKFTRVVSMVFTGPFEEVSSIYPKMMEWIESRGYKPAGPIMERYLTMPGPDVDPETYKTEVWIPILK
jgi:effector-binding domain-containing protein